jgi:ribosomal protein S3AE
MAIAKIKKKFFSVEIPAISKETNLLGYGIEDFDGIFLKYDLTRMLRGKSSLARFRVEVKEGKAIAKPVELSVLSYFIKRMVRKGTDYIESSFLTECSDASVTIKFLLVSRRKTSRVVRNALRNRFIEEMKNYLKEKDSESIFRELMRGQIQKDLGVKLKKVYPLSLCEIRVFKVEKFLENKKNLPEIKKETISEEKVAEVVREKAPKENTEKNSEEVKK